jgi:hypothetical protein
VYGISTPRFQQHVGLVVVPRRNSLKSRGLIEWADLLRDLDRLQEATIEKEGIPRFDVP